MEMDPKSPNRDSLDNFCVACQRLLNNEIEVAKPCSFKSPYDKKPSKDEFRIVEEYFVHHTRGGQGLAEAAANGCILCRHIFLSMSKPDRDSICKDHSKTGFEASDFVTQYKFRFNGCDTTMSKYCVLEYKVRTFRELIADNTTNRMMSLGDEVEKRFYLIPWADDSAKSSPTPDLKSCSASCVDQIQSWLELCSTEHDCMQNASIKQVEPSEYPARLIDVGTKSDPVLKLCEAKNIGQIGPYTTLSHCWGKAKFFTMVTSNLAELKEKIDMTKLSKTHQEAIHLTRALGIRHLWIDSLCIIQDSDQDWTSESARMMTIYSNSYCNIAATAAASGSQGLFFERDDGDIDPVKFKLPSKAKRPATRQDNESIELVRTVFQSMKYSKGGKEYTPGKFDTFYFTDADVWTNDVPKSPLGKRAWCLQERVLSPRTVHFGEKQLLFQCQSLHACSRFPDGIPPLLIPSQETHANLSLRNAVKAARPDDARARQHAFQIWQNLVATYSTCDLTYGKDKLVALSGMASYLGKHFQLGNYLAGVWSYGAFDQLLWAPIPNPSLNSFSCSRPKTYQAPSWSWASVNYPTTFTEPGCLPLAKLTEGVVFNKRPEYQYGEVKFGALVLYSVLIPAKPYTQFKAKGPSEHGFVTVLGLGDANVFVEPIFDDWLDSKAKDFVCAPLAFVAPHKHVVGLVLLPTEVKEIQDLPDPLPKYRRVGFFELHSDAWARYRGRQVKPRYTVERGADGLLYQRWPNNPEPEPDLREEDRAWATGKAEHYLIA